MSGVEVLVAVVIAVGLVGIVVPVLPGSILVLGALLVWAWETGGSAWGFFAAAALFLAAGAVVKYLVPNRRLKEVGVPASTQWIGAAAGVVGFFVIPVIGLFIGFVLGVYVAEHRRVGGAAAWPSTKHALKAVGVSILIELAAGLAATGIWVAGVLVT